ncbi:MAG: 50S ribosomal protein L9 [Spirochaetales bacterium]|nr:50S ribosomal protein L9 [Spirochaetales bacterium]
MKVILNSDVANLGEEGDICTVAPGYARNYLLPQGLVLEYNDHNAAIIESRRSEIEAKKEEKRRQAASMKERIESEAVVIRMTAGTNGRLFGSVTSATIVERLAAKGIEVERKKIEVPENSLKSTGNYKVRIRLYGDGEATLLVTVEAENAKEIEAAKKSEAEAADDNATEDIVADETPTEEGADEPGDEEEEILDPEVMAMRAAAEEEAAESDEE